MNIKKLNKAITEALDDGGIKILTDAIEAEMDYQGFRDMSVEVDESSYEPAITIFTSEYGEYSEKQADLINEKFNVFKTTEHLGGAEVYTESDVNTLTDTDGETKSEGGVTFVAVVDSETEITPEFAETVAKEYVQQMINFWDEVYSDELVSEVNESVKNKRTNKKAIKETFTVSIGDIVTDDEEELEEKIYSFFCDELGFSDVTIENLNESIKTKKSAKRKLKEEKNAYVIYNKDECPIYNTIGCEECDLAADGSCLIGQDLRKLEKSVEHIK